MKVYLRADASADIGYGHFIRTLALADILKDDFDCVFVTQSPTEYQKSEVAKVCALHPLPAADDKSGLFLGMLRGGETVVLDNYFYGTDYQRAVRGKGCKLVCIDDMHDKHYVADMVINHSPGVSERDYSKEPYTRLCLGLSYALLRKPFLEAAAKRRPRLAGHKALDVVMAFGGADRHDLTARYVGCLKDCDTIRSVTAVIGDAYPAGRRAECRKVSYARNLSAQEMARLFCGSDIALLPASTVMKEALACNVRIIGGYFADNQYNSFRSFEKMKAIIGAGDFRDSETEARVRRLFDGSALENIELRQNVIPSSIRSSLLMAFKSLCDVHA